MSEHSYKAVVFDFNGTLFQDSDFNEEAWRRFLHKTFHASVDDADFMRFFHGRPNSFIFSHYMGRDLTPEEVHHLSEDGKEALYRRLVLEHPERLTLTEGAPELLDRLKAADVPVSIATAAGRGNMDFYFEHLGIGRWFDYDTNIIYNDGKLPGKPEPDIYLKSFEKIGSAPEETIVVEDALLGLESAERAGAGMIVGIDPAGTNGLNSVAGVDHVIASFKDWQDSWVMA